MSSKNTSPFLSVGPRSVLASRPLLLGEDFGLTPGATQCTTAVCVNAHVRICAGAVSDGRPYRDNYPGVCRRSVGSVVGNVVPLREVTHDKPYFEQLSLTIVKFVTVM